MNGAKQEAAPDRKCLVELGFGQTAQGDYLDKFTEDAIRVVGSGIRIRHVTLIDSKGAEEVYRNKGHRDGIQLISPGYMSGGLCIDVSRAQYASGEVNDILIMNCHIRSVGKLQGIFCSDGRVSNIRILGNVLQTRGFHYISLSGVQSGLIQGNVKEDGTPCPVHLWPDRIGGNMDGDIVCIIGYVDPRYHPRPLEEIMPNAYERSFAKDRRSVIKDNPNVTYLTDFDLDGYQAEVLKMDVPRDVLAHTQALKALARKFGERIYAA